MFIKLPLLSLRILDGHEFCVSTDSIAECALCQAIISTIDNLLADPRVDHQIEDVVSRVCNYLPGAKQGKVRITSTFNFIMNVNLFPQLRLCRIHNCVEKLQCSSRVYF